MRTPLALALLTAAGFGVGLGAGYWMASTCKPMPPPTSMFSEFRDITRAGRRWPLPPELWRGSTANWKKLRPEIDAFRKKLQVIDGEFKRPVRSHPHTGAAPKARRLATTQGVGPRSVQRTGCGKEAVKEPAKAAKPAAAPATEPTKSGSPAPPERAIGANDLRVGRARLLVGVCAVHRRTFHTATRPRCHPAGTTA